MDWTGLSRTALQKTEMDGTALHWTGLDCLRLSLTSPDCITLHYPGLDWNVPYRTVSSMHLARLICTENRKFQIVWKKRIILTNDYILPMKPSMCFLFMT